VGAPVGEYVGVVGVARRHALWARRMRAGVEGRAGIVLVVGQGRELAGQLV
jgi:hypothetical protein